MRVRREGNVDGSIERDVVRFDITGGNNRKNVD